MHINGYKIVRLMNLIGSHNNATLQMIIYLFKRLKMIWMEKNDGNLNQEQWHALEVKSIVWDKCITFGKMAWKRVRRLIKTPSPFLKEAFLSKFDTSWDTRDISYHKSNVNIR